MSVSHVELFVEEPSMEALLREILPKLIVQSFAIFTYSCKPELLGRLSARLRGYAKWLPQDWRLVIVVDRDDDDCHKLKRQLEDTATSVGLATRSAAGAIHWRVVNRIAIEELESWYFGDWEAVRKAYPRVPSTIPNKAPFRDPDAITGGTWEAFERVLKRAGYFSTGLRKIEAARSISKYMDPTRNRSRSFQNFRDALTEIPAL